MSDNTGMNATMSSHGSDDPPSTGRFLAYPAYLDSGLPWQGQVPAHWNLTRLRFIARLNPSKSEIGNLPPDTEVSFLPMNAIGNDGSLRLDATRPLSAVEQGYTYFRDGDLLIAKITPCFENGKGALATGLLGGIGFGTTELIVVRPLPGRAVGAYLHWLFAGTDFRNAATAAMYGAGGQKRVPDEFVRDFVVAVPPPAEQRAIAAFLDRECGKMDVMVAEQERLIALLKEKRQAVISHAITKGLDQTAPMKDSGATWIGYMPAAWTVLPLKRLAQTCTERATTRSFPVGLEHIESWSGRLIHRETQFEGDGTLFQRGDILFGKLRPYLAKVWLADRTGEAVGDFYVIRTGWQYEPEFLKYVLLSRDVISLIDGSTYGAKMPRADWEFIGSLPMPLPSLTEQRAIAAFLNSECSRIDALIAEAETMISLLRERRSALISAAGTGQIDVRTLSGPS
jgi:restriction endonuclease S subunit